MSWRFIDDRSAVLYVRGITAEERGLNGCAVRSVVISERVSPQAPDTMFYSDIELLPLTMWQERFVDIGGGMWVPGENVKRLERCAGGGVYCSGELVLWQTRVHLRKQWLASIREIGQLRIEIEDARARGHGKSAA